jgi:hypothetical protein
MLGYMLSWKQIKLILYIVILILIVLIFLLTLYYLGIFIALQILAIELIIFFGLNFISENFKRKVDFIIESLEINKIEDKRYGLKFKIRNRGYEHAKNVSIDCLILNKNGQFKCRMDNRTNGCPFRSWEI